ncbi:PspC domain-containing protein [Arthrobacter sp. TMN-49]
MNNTQDTPEQAAGPSPAPETPAPDAPAPQPESAKFFRWLRNLGVQRGPNRWVGGVCSGLANRWGIDPVIVRGLAVVLTLFFGVGLLAYGVAWALLPEPDGRIHVEEVARGRWSTGMTGASVVTFLGLVGPGQGFLWGDHDGWFPWPLFWIAAVGGIVYWAINRGKSTDQQPVQGGVNAQFAPQQYPTQQHGVQQPYAPPLPAGTAPSAQQYAGQQYAGQRAPFLPPQQFMQAPPKQPRPVKTKPRLSAAASLFALGLAIVVGAVVLILNATNVIDLNGYHVATAAAAAGITAGVAIVAAGLMGRAAGGVGAFAIVSLVVGGLFSLPVHDGQFTVLQKVTWAPQSVRAAEPGRTLVLSNATVDLTQFDDGTTLTSDVLVQLELAASNVILEVPTSIPVRIESQLAAASLTIDGDDNGGAFAEESTTDLNPDATGHGLIITLRGAASDITVVPVAGQ